MSSAGLSLPLHGPLNVLVDDVGVDLGVIKELNNYDL